MAFLFPWAVAKDAFSVDYRKLRKCGIRGIILDMDYTLVPYNRPADERTLRLLEEIRASGLRCMVVSNNRRPRGDHRGNPLAVGTAVSAKKPLPFGLRSAARRMGLPPRRIAAVGDQIFTDVLGANLAGMKSVLVGRVDREREFQLLFKSVFEKAVLFAYRHSGRKRSVSR